MARRNQPYIPLYADDFQTDEKLIMCSAESTGVFIRIMCLMHKSESYGKILLKQKFKQTSKQTENFASQLAIYFPYDVMTIARSLTELVAEDVLQIDGDFLVQKRMVRDAEISEIRKGAGEKGGKKSAEKRSKVIGGMGEKGLAIVNKRETRPASLESALALFTELGRPDQAQEFMDYYDSNGWKVGRNPMKDWKATARRWVRNAKPMSGEDRKLLKGTTVHQHNEGLERFKAIMEAKQNGTGQPS